MKLTFKAENKMITVILKGDLVTETADKFKAAVRKELQHEKKPLLLNLDKLSHIDSHGFDALGSVLNAAVSNDLNLIIFVSNATAHQKLKDSPYYEFLPVYSDEAEARHELFRPRKGAK